MHSFHNSRNAGVSNIVFASSIIVLIVIAASGFGLYLTTPSHTAATVTTSSTSSEMMTTSMTSESSMMTSSSQNGTCACEFVLQSGAMISNAWLLSAPLHMGGYAVAIHAEGLEPNGTYLVEGALSSGPMAVVPISNQSMTMSHVSDSEFQANANGTGQFWIELGSNPTTTFETIDLAFLPGMSMQNATIVATVSMSSMTTSMTSESSMMTSSSMMSESTSG